MSPMYQLFDNQVPGEFNALIPDNNNNNNNNNNHFLFPFSCL